MSHRSDCLKLAHARAQASALPYSGALLPGEAWSLLQSLPAAVLLDVRTAAEWQFVGVVPGAQAIEWKTWPGMQPNAYFMVQAAQQIDKEALVMVLCRTGARSDEAARQLAAHGFSSVYNVLEGFEGERDADGHRGRLSGWKARGLPWQQP